MGFQKRCTEYTESAAMYKSFKKTSIRIKFINNHKYIPQYKSLYILWTEL